MTTKSGTLISVISKLSLPLFNPVAEAVIVTVWLPSLIPSLIPVIVKVAEVCPAAIVTVLGTVASVVLLELRVTIKSLLVLVLRVRVAVAVPVSEITLTGGQEG